VCRKAFGITSSVAIPLCWFLVATHSAAAANPLAARPSIHPDGSGSLAAADFNGDGIPDLALAHPTSNSVLIYFGAADGSFAKQPARTVSTGAEIPKEPVVRRQAVVAADVNGDGKADLIVTNSTAGVVSILFGRGDGSFAAPIVAPTLAVPTGLATGDFDGDGKMDLAIVSQGANKVSIWLGKGDGNFMPSRDFVVGRAPTSIVAGDFGTSEHNPARDGKLDLAVTATGDGQIDVLFGDGSGGFSTAATYGAPGATSVVAADFNGDGVLDLATASPSTGQILMTIGFNAGTDVCFANGNIEATLPGQPTSLAAVDLNHDGNLDLVVSTASAAAAESGVVVLLNHPRPRRRAVYFDPPVLCATGGAPAALVAGDLKGAGGVPGVAVADRGVNHVALLFGDGKGGLMNCGAPQQLGDVLPASAHTAEPHATGAAPAEKQARQTPER
jgi:hypothetical protein